MVRVERLDGSMVGSGDMIGSSGATLFRVIGGWVVHPGDWGAASLIALAGGESLGDKRQRIGVTAPLGGVAVVGEGVLGS